MTRRHATKYIGLVTLGTSLVLLAAVWLATPGRASSATFKSTLLENDIEEFSVAHRDLQYCDTTNPAQQLDLYVPKTRYWGSVPVVVHVHGGGWLYGDKVNGIEQRYAPLFASKGIAVATISYRLAEEAVYPAQNQDVQCAVQYLVENAARYNLDSAHIGIMGDSAGGHLAAMEALDNRRHIKAALMLYGVSDLWEQIKYYNDTNAIHYLGEKNQQLANQASPYFADLRKTPPFLLIHGSADTIVPASESHKFANKLRGFENQATFISVNGAEHAFVGGNDWHEARVRASIVNFFATRLFL
jgi:acetyl esterase/lipase